MNIAARNRYNYRPSQASLSPSPSTTIPALKIAAGQPRLSNKQEPFTPRIAHRAIPSHPSNSLTGSHLRFCPPSTTVDPTLTCLRGRVPEAACALVRSLSLARLGHRSSLWHRQPICTSNYTVPRRRHIYSVPTMDHFPRLRPHRRKRDITAPSLITTPTTTKSESTSRKTESPSAELTTPTATPSLRSVHKLRPFRVFSRSSKRARESSPASHKQTPTVAAVMASNGTADHPASPAESKTSSGQQLKKDGRPKMPSFLELSESGKLYGSPFGALTFFPRHID